MARCGRRRTERLHGDRALAGARPCQRRCNREARQITRALQGSGLASDESGARRGFLVSSRRRRSAWSARPSARTIELLVAWIALTERTARAVDRGPLVRSSSLALLGRLTTQSARRMLLIGTAAGVRARGRHGRTSRCCRSGSSPHGMRAMAALGADALPAATRHARRARRRHAAHLEAHEGRDRARRGARGPRSADARRFADGRLDRLSTVKEVAQQAAVIGRECSYELLALVSGLEEAALHHALDSLVEAEILFVRGDPPRGLRLQACSRAGGGVRRTAEAHPPTATAASWTSCVSVSRARGRRAGSWHGERRNAS